MLQTINCEQGTDEWFKCRLGKITASNFSKVLTATGEISNSLGTVALQLAGEVLSRKQEEIYKSSAMERGNELEPFARNVYEQHTLEKVNQIGFMYIGDIGYSPDGLVGEDGNIEIKCPSLVNHTKYLHDNKCPTIYIPQVQGGLYISGRQWCDFVSYHPDFKEKELFIKRIYRDEEYIKKLEVALKKLLKKKQEIIAKIKGNSK